MEKRVRDFVAFFVKTFLLVNFVVSSVVSMFASNQVKPRAESSTILVIAIVTTILALIEAFRAQ